MLHKGMLAVVALALGLMLAGRPADATPIGVGDFVSPTVVDFEGAPSAPIDGFYSALGLTFVGMWGGSVWDTGTGNGPSLTASDFEPAPQPPYLPGEIQFSPPAFRAGFYITTNDPDDTTVTAWLGATLVGSDLFDTGGDGYGGSFAGVQYAGPFDRLVIDPADNMNGAFSIDDLRFESAEAEIPEPATLALLALGCLGIWRRRR